MSAANDILRDYQHVIESLTLHTGGQGVFDVAVDGQNIYSKGETGRHANPGEAHELFAAHVGADVPVYDR